MTGCSRRRRSRAAVALVLLVLIASACSSTEQAAKKPVNDVSAGEPSDVVGEIGEDGEAAVGEPGEPGAPEAAGPAGSSSPAGAKPGRKSASQLPGEAGAVQAPSLPKSGRGYTEKEIFIGFPISKKDQHQKDAAALGISVEAVDAEKIIRTIVKDMNERGGILGRTVVPILHEVSGASSPQEYALEQEKACATWTQDNKVFAAITLNGYINDETLFACMANRDTPVLMTDNNFHSEAVLKRYSPHLYMPNVIGLERQVPVWLDRLEALKYFDGWDINLGRPGSAPPKVGLLYATARKEYVRWGEAVKAELGRRGHKVTDFVLTGNSNSEDVQQLNSAIFRMKSEGVTHLMSFVVVLAATTAEAQRYRPRWAISTYTNPYITQAAEPADQLNGALGVGNMPRVDLDGSNQPPDTADQARCKKLVEESGHSLSNTFAVGAMYQLCDAEDTLIGALSSSKELSTAGLRRGIESLTSIRTTFGISAGFGTNRHASGRALRDIGFDNSCKCMRYLSTKEHRV